MVAAIAIVTVTVAATARAGGAGSASKAPRPVKAYAGQVVISPDVPPARFADLPAFLAANAVEGGHYELLHWDVHFVGVIAKPTDKVTLEVANPADPKTGPLISIELAVKRMVVIGHFTPTKAAGFAADTPYTVSLAVGKSTVAKAELVLRPITACRATSSTARPGRSCSAIASSRSPRTARPRSGSS